MTTKAQAQNPESDAHSEAVPSNPSAFSASRRCEYCLLHHPLPHFRRRRRDGDARARQCRLCHNQAEQLRRQRKRGSLNKRQFHQHLTRLKNQRTGRGVERVYLELVQQFGGTEGLLRVWTQTIEKDMATGGFKAYRHIAAILRLMEYREDTQPNKPDYSTMSDEELMDWLTRATILDE